MYKFVGVRGHIEVYEDGKFILSADTMGEAYRELYSEEEEDG